MKLHTRDILGPVAAIVIGPSFLAAGYAAGLIFNAAASAYSIVAAVVVPLFVVLSSNRTKILTWQLAVASLVASVVGDNLRSNATQIAEVAFTFAVLGELLSSPLPLSGCFARFRVRAVGHGQPSLLPSLQGS